MPRRERPVESQRSERWLRAAVNEHREALNSKIAGLFKWLSKDQIEWVSPLQGDGYAEYFDESFLKLLDVSQLKKPLADFWPSSGPRWDGLAKSASRKILVEAKAYVEEAVDYSSRAANPTSVKKIDRALAMAKEAFHATECAQWGSPFYQYANRLAHLYFLRELNGLDAYLLFIYFADAGDVPNACSVQQWKGAIRVIEKCLGLTNRNPFKPYVGTIVWSVPEMLQSKF